MGRALAGIWTTSCSAACCRASAPILSRRGRFGQRYRTAWLDRNGKDESGALPGMPRAGRGRRSIFSSCRWSLVKRFTVGIGIKSVLYGVTGSPGWLVTATTSPKGCCTRRRCGAINALLKQLQVATDKQFRRALPVLASLRHQPDRKVTEEACWTFGDLLYSFDDDATQAVTDAGLVVVADRPVDLVLEAGT